MHYYTAGLSPPEDVTLLFSDDNYGNMHRLPIRNESKRAGGCGVSSTVDAMIETILMAVTRSIITSSMLALQDHTNGLTAITW
jgi:hypothetical protein